MTTLQPELRTFAERTLRLSALLAEAARTQWQPSHAPTPRDDTTERSKGGHGDPTFATVADDRRLALRAAVLNAEHALGESTKALAGATKQVSEALDRWAGEYPEMG